MLVDEDALVDGGALVNGDALDDGDAVVHSVTVSTRRSGARHWSLHWVYPSSAHEMKVTRKFWLPRGPDIVVASATLGWGLGRGTEGYAHPQRLTASLYRPLAGAGRRDSPTQLRMDDVVVWFLP